MRLRADQLANHLQKQCAPVYVVSGDEPFQREEASNFIRQRAQELGYSERDVLHAEKNFDWGRLSAAAGALSLFAEKRSIDLRLPSAKPGDAGSKALIAYCQSPPEDTLLLLTTGKLEKAQQNSKWFKALDNAGVIVQVWPIEAAQMPAWIGKRMQMRGMQPTPEAVSLLADRLEGNLLAADQELEKLRLFCGAGEVDAEQVAAAVSDSARFDIFDLVDAALLGRSQRVLRILHGLRGEGLEPNLVLWALSREIRQLASMAWRLSQGERAEQVMAQFRVWTKRKPAVQAGLKRHSAKQWQRLLYQAGQVERIVKGRAAGAVWDELVQLSLNVAGINLFRRRSA